jgi:hypothetical protein
MTGSEVGHLSLIDGGVFANNPTLAALSEATGSCGCMTTINRAFTSTVSMIRIRQLKRRTNSVRFRGSIRNLLKRWIPISKTMKAGATPPLIRDHRVISFVIGSSLRVADIDRPGTRLNTDNHKSKFDTVLQVLSAIRIQY